MDQRAASDAVHRKAEDVDGYPAEIPQERQETLRRLRQMCRQALEGFVEVMAYGMPAYERNGVGEVAFAGQKNCISVYLLRSDVREAFAERPAGYDMGKACLRIRRPENIDFDLVRDLLRATAAGPGTVC
ncbi:iron chaperone [Streptomyces sp. NPDC056653]|uniref:iron chaperone n=1 Tax=Streptomyces sp. NPDC056653 TaxID=3345894 RepID=UPI0036C46472